MKPGDLVRFREDTFMPQELWGRCGVVIARHLKGEWVLYDVVVGDDVVLHVIGDDVEVVDD